MAIAFIKLSICKRSKGQSSINAAAYRSGSKLRDNNTGVSHDYTKQKTPDRSLILLPRSCGKVKYKNREYLWNKVEKREKRINSQTAYILTMGLPIELNLSSSVKLVKEYAKEQYLQKDIICDINIYKSSFNPYAYIMMPTRYITEDGFGHKINKVQKYLFLRPGNMNKAEFKTWPEEWCNFQNNYFIKNNINITVDLMNIETQFHEGHIPLKSKYYKNLNTETMHKLLSDDGELSENTLLRIKEKHPYASFDQIEKLKQKIRKSVKK